MKLNKIKPETHTLLKEIGFDIIECTCGGYPECICTDWNVPTQALVQQWLREEYDVYLIPKPAWFNYGETIGGETKLDSFAFTIESKQYNYHFSDEFQTHEEALEAGIIECVKILKEESCG